MSTPDPQGGIWEGGAGAQLNFSQHQGLPIQLEDPPGVEEAPVEGEELPAEEQEEEEEEEPRS